MPDSDSSTPRRILVVDDHVDTAVAMGRLLGMLDYQVQVAHSFGQALEVAKAGSFDLLLTDIVLPDGNGLELLPHLREMGSPKLKGVTVSGFDEDEDRKRSRAAGFDGHFTKPIRFEKLQVLVTKLLNSM